MPSMMLDYPKFNTAQLLSNHRSTRQPAAGGFLSFSPYQFLIYNH